MSFGAYIYLHKNVSYEEKESPESKNSIEYLKPADERKFIKQGELTFLRKGNKEKIIRIDIEIADNPDKRALGLMYRNSMPDHAGMLFIYEKSQLLLFWMKNTYIPLDIVFADENLQIVRIQKNSKPLSEQLIPSYRNSMYVVEVNAGFSDSYGIKVGDYLRFETKP